MSIVTLEEAKIWLNYDDDTPTEKLRFALLGAESEVLAYITDTFSDGVYPDAIKKAVVVLAAHDMLYSNAEAETTENGNYLPAPVQRMLYHYRKPTVI